MRVKQVLLKLLQTALRLYLLILNILVILMVLCVHEVSGRMLILLVASGEAWLLSWMLVYEGRHQDAPISVETSYLTRASL